MARTRKQVAESTLDKKARHLVYARPGGCVACNMIYEGYEAAHIVPRARRITRWCQGNMLKMCHLCHVYYTTRPLEWWKFCGELLGEEHMSKLRRLSNLLFANSGLNRNDVHLMLSYSLDEWIEALKHKIDFSV
jgi:hypothetical protein